MMQRTDRHQRYFLRLISRHALLYTEMIPAAALAHGHAGQLLEHDPAEHPLALQLGGSDPDEMAAGAQLAEACGFKEVNINVGCPSGRVQAGGFGACLMAEPQRVARCVMAMREAVRIPVTVKMRIGIDHLDSYDHLAHFIQAVALQGCRTFIVHARKAWLQGLSTRQNRQLPPLRYDRVKRLKGDFPQLEIVLNGGIQRLDEAERHLANVDGVMIGREAYRNPYLFASVDRRFFGDPHPVPSRHQVLEAYLPYVDRHLSRGIPLYSLSHHLFGLFQKQPGARAWRRYLSEHAAQPQAGLEVLRAALEQVPTAIEPKLRD